MMIMLKTKKERPTTFLLTNEKMTNIILQNTEKVYK